MKQQKMHQQMQQTMRQAMDQPPPQVPMPPSIRTSPPHPNLPLRLLAAAAAGLLLSLLYVFWPTAHGLNAFILQLRGERLLLMFLLAVCGGVGTLIFQTITGNRLLTPQLMGMESLYRLLQALLIWLLGNQLYTQLPAGAQFAAATGVSVAVSTFFFVFVLKRLRGDLFRLLLIGLIFSVFCRALTEFISRLLDPLAYAVYQGATFAQISRADMALIGLAAPACALITALLWCSRHTLDVLALGRETAIGLGVAYLPAISLAMMGVATLVAIATALVGPMLFFGLLASALAYRFFPTPRHAVLLPGVALTAYAVLLGGQLIFERLLNMAGTLSMAVEFAGGLLFLLLIARRPQHP